MNQIEKKIKTHKENIELLLEFYTKMKFDEERVMLVKSNLIMMLDELVALKKKSINETL